ncbi:uncharacterized protein FIBRA_09549 [Fibroporia radiculosa]|uniref:Uncharacterized protein n=1 Tax=Fibroporia radiculosa TaxID=599839 RepID=J7SCI5_9APHY|nr:uncharacterized protein FIBRA_09549 [Fibroporia radiculosa]CCM07206.1 predicted protein [Fibroporia radiculosa]
MVAQQPATLMSQEQEERRFRIAQPGRFANNSKEQTFEQFVEKLAVWYAHQRVTADRDRIMGVLALLEGRAHTVAGNYYRMVKDSKDLGKYDDFLHQMRRAFTTTDQEEDARQEFLRMLKKYETVAAKDTAKFIGEFRGLADLVKSTDSELIAAIRDRLHREIKNVLAARASSQWPKKWSEYCDYVLDICRRHGYSTIGFINGPIIFKGPERHGGG